MTKTKPISQKLAEKTFRELGLNPKTGKPLFRSKLGDSKRVLEVNKRAPFRISALEKTMRQSPRGKAYQYSALYRNAIILRLLVKKFTEGLSSIKHHRLIDQLDSSARSVVANIREGYLRPTSAEYSVFLGYSHGSLEEIRGDVEDTKDDGLLSSHPVSSLAGIGIELKPSLNISPKKHLEDLKRKLGDIKREQLAYEIFVELINKTDYLLKRAVQGIDKKIIADEEKKLNQELANIRRRYW